MLTGMAFSWFVFNLFNVTSASWVSLSRTVCAFGHSLLPTQTLGPDVYSLCAASLTAGEVAVDLISIRKLRYLHTSQVAAKSWTSVPSEIRHAKNLNTFRSQLFADMHTVGQGCAIKGETGKMGRGGGQFLCYSFGGEVYPDARAYLGSEGRRNRCHRYRRNAQDHRRHRWRCWDTGCWHKLCLQCTTTVKDGAATTPATTPAPATACGNQALQHW